VDPRLIVPRELHGRRLFQHERVLAARALSLFAEQAAIADFQFPSARRTGNGDVRHGGPLGAFEADSDNEHRLRLAEENAESLVIRSPEAMFTAGPDARDRDSETSILLR